MAYAIQSFQCTDLGLEQLTYAQSQTKNDKAVPMASEEVECLFLINEYQKTNISPSRLNKIEVRFQTLYETVNLTRLVVLKLLKFNSTPIRNPQITDNETRKNPPPKAIDNSNKLADTPKPDNSATKEKTTDESRVSIKQQNNKLLTTQTEVNQAKNGSKELPPVDPMLVVATGVFFE